MAPTKYRPDIDGLRAIAVLSVFLYHLGIAGFGGGFVGVDIFFVISGYLITQLIRDEVLATHSFSYTHFYLRRARRLFPALFVTLLASTGLATVLLSPQHLELFGGSLVHAITSVSNFFFWREAGYFDESSAMKPLLHTWSLGIEEQFYLLWPITLVLLLKINNRIVAPLALLVLGVCSLSINPIFADGHVQTLSTLSARFPQWLNISAWIADGSATIFYLLPFRIFEFVIGGLVAWSGNQARSTTLGAEVTLAAGLALIVYAVTRFTEDMVFPSVNALVPCIGAALVIRAGRATWLGRLLSNPLAVGLGLISYSLYLVHWPIIVFWEYATNDDLDSNEKLGAVVIAIALAYLMYRYVERPFRGRSPSGSGAAAPALSNAAFGLIMLVLSIALLLPASSMWSNGGWSWRVPLEVRALSENLAESRDATWAYVEKNNLDVFPHNNKENLVIVGDSHGKDLFNAFAQNERLSAAFNVAYVKMRFECIKGIADSGKSITWSDEEATNISLNYRCPNDLKLFRQSPLFSDADKVAVSFRWSKSDSLAADLVAMNAFLQTASASKARFNVFGGTVEFKESVPQLVMAFGRVTPRDTLEKYVAEFRDTSVDEINALLATTSNEQGWLYIDKQSLLCDAQKLRCDVLTADNKLIYFDYGHWTLDGARWVGDKIAKGTALQQLHGISEPLASGAR